MKKTSQLRALLASRPPEFLLEAHNGLSAKIAEGAGFPALWASGLSIAASLGVRDNNEASWTQVLEVIEFMADATSVPILVDGDTGFGNFNNFRRFVRKLGERGLAGVCLEDKVFPKTNSFLRGGTQPLAPIEEFCGKIRAGKDAQTDADFVLVARTEALVAGWGVPEALRRAEAYRLAGADAVVVHSGHERAEGIFAFLDEWADRLPVILIPTKYHTTPISEFARRRVALVVWANHLLRASLAAMQRAAEQIRRESSVTNLERGIAPLSEVFRLQGDDELLAAVERYEPAPRPRSAVILAATRGGEALHPLTRDVPKALLRVGGVTLLDRLCGQLAALHVRDFSVVAGYRKDSIAREGLRRIDNPAWSETDEAASLALAREHLKGDCIVAFGDVLCSRHILEILLGDPGDIAIVADRSIRPGKRDVVRLMKPAPHAFLDEGAALAGAASTEERSGFDAEWFGLVKLSPAGGDAVRAWLARSEKRADFPRLPLVCMLDDLAREGAAVAVHLVTGGWTTIEDALDLAEASNV